MCKASHIADKTVDAEVGTTLGIGRVDTHDQAGRTVGGFHSPGSTTAECVHCVQTGTKLTVENIPAAIREQYDLGPSEVATFLQYPQWNRDDQLVFDRNKATVDLQDLADQDVTVFVGIRAVDTKDAVDKIMTDAVADLPIKGDAPAREHEPA